MERYRTKTRLGQGLDALLLRAGLLALGVGWFSFLWGLTGRAVLAGLALGVLMILCVRAFRRRTLHAREQQMRRALGGELALRALLLEPADRAQFQAAMWLAPRYDCELIRTSKSGVLCRWKGESTLIVLVNRHESAPVTAQEVVKARRETVRSGAKQCLLCATAPVAKEAAAYADTGEPRVTLVEREELKLLAGLASPATNEQLAALGRARTRRAGWRRWVRHVLSPKRSKRYFWYGLALAGLFLITGLPYYPIPAVACLSLCVASRVYAARREGRAQA